MIITLIRHTSVDVQSGICYGQSNVEVSSTFETEAQQVLIKLQKKTFDAVYCSPLKRCLKLVGYCGFAVPVIDRRIMELNFGAWEMKAWLEIEDAQLHRWFDNWMEETPTQGESFKGMICRVAEFLTELKSLPFHHVAIFTHAGVIRSVGIITKKFSSTEAFDFKVEYGDCLEFYLE